jgi:hypothetical protein
MEPAFEADIEPADSGADGDAGDFSRYIQAIQHVPALPLHFCEQ